MLEHKGDGPIVRRLAHILCLEFGFEREVMLYDGNKKRWRADFACYKLKMVIELDGPQHQHPSQKSLDQRRDARLKERGWEVLRLRIGHNQ